MRNDAVSKYGLCFLDNPYGTFWLQMPYLLYEWFGLCGEYSESKHLSLKVTIITKPPSYSSDFWVQQGLFVES